MFARVSTYQSDTERLLEGFRRTTEPLSQLEGFERAYLLTDAATGRAMTITLWESQAAMAASADWASRAREHAMHESRRGSRIGRRLRGRAHRREAGAAMKFHATVIFEFNVHDVAEAGERLNSLLEQARDASLEARSIELATPPGTSVTLPQVVPSGRW
jgi:heme-degrading monooxygenase HmoA